MATYKAIANGNADTLGIWEIWDGSAWVEASVLPGESDDVYTNGFIVTVTTSQSYNSWNRSSVAAPLSITQGGQFQIDGGNDILISGDIYGTNVQQTNGSPLSACVNRLATHTGTLSIIGNQNGGSHLYTYGFFNNSTFEITSIVGNQNGGASNAYGIYNNAAATFLSIVGNQNGGSVSVAYGFYNNAASTFLSIVGNQNGGSVSVAYGFYNNAASTFLSIVGNQNGGSGTNAYGFYNAIANLNIPFQGNAYASVAAAAIYNLQATTTIIYTGNIYNNLGLMAIRTERLFLNVTPTTVWEFSDFGGDTQYLYGAGVNTGHPIEADVRKDTVYGPNNEFKGTLAVPPPESVVKNIPTDDTVGSLPIAQTINSQDVTDIMSNIANIEIKIDNVDNKIDTIDTSINTVNNNISNMNIDINTIENELDTAITNINTIDGKVDVIDGKIDTLPTDTLNELKQDDLGERLSKVGTIEEMTNIIINSCTEY